MIQTRERLDRQGCGTKNCTHDHAILYMHSRCHPQAGLDVRYVKADGVLEIHCKLCHKPMAAIQVARGGEALDAQNQTA